MSPEKRLTLAACVLGSGVVFLDQTVVNVALPAIQRNLGASLAGQQWIVAAYLLTLSSLLLVGGSLDDLFERRSVFMTGLAGFGACSLACALAPGVGLLIAARVLQGAFGALLVPSSLAIVMTSFPRAERGAAIGTWTAWTGMAQVVGPLVGGVLIDSVSWRLIFLINVPLVLGTLALAARAIPRIGPAEPGARIDVVGGALATFGLGAAVFALIEEPRLGVGNPAVWGAALGGVAALAAFVLHERRTANPMLPLTLFRERNFAVGNVTTFTQYAGLGGGLFLIGLFLQQVARYSALAAGASLLPVTLLMFTLSPPAGRLAGRFGPRAFMTAGPLACAGGFALLVLRVTPNAPYATEVLPAVILFGVGLALTVAPLTATVLGAVDERRSGVASGVNNQIARVAGLIAVAALGAFVAGRFGAALDDQLAGHPLSPVARRAVAAAKPRSLSTIEAAGVPGSERPLVTHALERASVSAFRLGLGIGAGALATGGLVAFVGIANPRRRLTGEEPPRAVAASGAPRAR